MEYRMDFRTEEQFKQDIKTGNEREQKAIKLFTEYVERVHGLTIDIEENGVDMSGEFIKDIQNVNANADYLVGTNKLPLEVKTSVGHTSTIFLKVKQLKSYIQQGASLLFVNGIDQATPAFTLWTTDDLQHIVDTHEQETPPRKINGGKLSYRLDAKKWGWSTFDGKEKVYV